ncbi:MAG: rhomboid family intramembrane serine protease [Acidobacteriota bacterium]
MIPLRDAEPSYSRPLVTVLIIVANTVAFVYQLSLDPFSRNHLVEIYGVIPARLALVPLLTSMFLHAGWLHFLGNMWFLWIYGDNVEDILGRAKYVLFYLACGVAAGMVHVAANLDSRLPTIGASGAIAGVMGAYVVKFPRARIRTLIPVIVFFTVIEIPAIVVLGYWFLIQILSGVTAHGGGGVAWFAHVGGFLTGALLVNLMRPRPAHSRRRDLHW